MSIEREYEIVLQPEPEGGFSVFVPELPSVATQGETIEEATEMAKEAIEAYLEALHEDGLPTPTSTAAASQSAAVLGRRIWTGIAPAQDVEAEAC